MKQSESFTRSDEPIWWLLFSAGGVCVALLVAPLILLLVLGQPLGLLAAEDLDYVRIRELIYHPLAIVFIGAVIVLPLFHAAHRIHHGLHDLQLAKGLAAKSFCYGSAMLLGAMGLMFWLWGFLMHLMS